MAGKHSDAPRIKQVDNSFGKEDFTIYKFPAVPSDTFTNIYTLSKWGLQTSSSELNQKKKKKIVMARGKDIHFSKASQPVKMSMNFFTRELRGSSAMSAHTARAAPVLII